jgi:hypothetical protein
LAAAACALASAAWEDFESIVTLAAASQREGAAAFLPWELAFCIFSVSPPRFSLW